MSQRNPNPYHPGFNQQPVVLAGRDGLLEDVTEALEVAANDQRTPRPILLIGPRGVGKTVTLGEIAELAGRNLAWPTVHVEATPDDLLRNLTRRLIETTQLLEGEAPTTSKRRARIAGGKVTAAAFGVGAEIQLESITESLTPAERLETTLRYAMETAIARDAGIVVTLDEIHTAGPADLGVFAAILQEHVPDRWPLVVVAAGLPSLRTNRGKRKLPTYLERAEWHDLGPLDLADATKALTGPAEQSARPMTTAAANELLNLCGGYPYAIQVAGHYAWRASTGATEITLAHAQQARPRIEADLEQLFKSRWADASERERTYLQAVAAVATTTTPTGGAVARHLGVSTPEVSYLRERLIKKGTLYAGADGALHFITPGLGTWITRTIAAEEPTI